MTTVKPTGPDLDELKAAAKRLKKANGLFAFAKKESDAAKQKFRDWLKAERKIDVETLAIGEIVNIEDVCLVEIGKQNRFDEKSFILEQQELHARYKKDFGTIKYKPMV